MPRSRIDVAVLLAALWLLQHPRAGRPDLRAGLDTLYGGGFYLPRGLAVSEGNCLWRTTGDSDPIRGQVADPLFKTDVRRFGPSPSLTTQARADFALQDLTPCSRAGSSITSIKVLVATAT